MTAEIQKPIPKPYQKRPPAEIPEPSESTPPIIGNGKTIPSQVNRDIEWPI